MNTRNLFKTSAALLAAMAAFATATLFAQSAPTKNAQSPPKPNVIVFLVDDMGWQDTSLPFWKEKTPQNRMYHTPSMERLAAQGEMFTNAYANAICTPSRVSLMTGWNAAHHRVTNWTLHFDRGTDADNPALKPPLWNVNGLSNSPDTPRTVFAPTLPQELQKAGYTTIICGKGHLGATKTPGADPKNLGFDVSIASGAAGAPGSYLGQHNYSGRWRGADPIWDVPGLEQYHGTDTFLTEALTIEANKAVNNAIAAKKPFFLYLAHYAVHVPLEKDDRFYQKYKDAGLGDKAATYAAMVEGMDKSLGAVMDNLEKQGVAENTIIVFMSDNGGYSLEERGGPPGTQNAPLRSGKGSPYEGGLRVPMIVKWPNVTQKGSRCDVPVIVDDFMPTILRIAGVDAPRSDGLDLQPWLRDARKAAPGRALLFHYPNAWGEGGPSYAYYTALRRDNWKLIFRYAPRKFELYDVQEDIGEKNNLAAQQPQKVEELAGEMRKLLTGYNAQMPLDKKTGQPAAPPGE